MLSQAHLDALQIIHARLAPLDVVWAITGGTGFALQGLDFAPNDIDLQTDREGAARIGEALAPYVVAPVAYRVSERMRSWVGRLAINGVAVEIMGDIQKKSADGSWDQPPDLGALRHWVEVDGMRLPVLSLAYEYGAYLKLGRTEKAVRIKSWLDAHQARIFWCRLDLPGHEAAFLEPRGSFWHLAGGVALSHGGAPCFLTYEVTCDRQWLTRSARVSGWVGSYPVQVNLTVDAAGRWRYNGAERPGVGGCIDLDLNFSPSTNLLPIRRLQLAVGQEATVQAAFLRFPDFALEPLQQRYRRTGTNSYRYESAGGFTAELQVNDAGLVTFYPDLCTEEPL